MADETDRGAFIWYELMTPDPGGAKAFYDAVVGWDVQSDGQAMPNGSEYRMIGRSDGGNAGGVLTLTEAMQAGGARPGWIGYICHPDVDGAAKTVTDAGGTVHMPPMDMPGVGRMAMVADPWGATFYVMDPVPPEGDSNAKSDVHDPDRAQHMRWHDVWTGEDSDAAAALYADLFGWRTEGGMPMGDGREYRFLTRSDRAFGGMAPALTDGPGPRMAFYIGVDDIDRAVAAVKDGGGELFGEPQSVPGGDYSVHIRDPQGASVGLVGPREEQPA
ncbi:VOC family protein [Aurantiacibacter luteus]|uniref:VOC domain-containing protein n=1 Tax=Aurantiacibacter luteus TaxID=1581420 RepID=A0A0G9N0V5_9SPHN|nr:VOC family protein [Aurantiacibacter luteus]KLE35158.1 hypothetical protein AAW00_01355 [Aurantiacibacter luteus]